MDKDQATAERAVVEFHRQLDAGNYAALYASADPEMKKAVTQKDFLSMLDAVHRKLGSAVTSVQRGSHVDARIGGNRVSFTYETKFSAGDGMEAFAYHIDSGRAVLLGYNIQSMALITK